MQKTLGYIGMNPVHLRTFLTVCKHRSYTRAAAELFLTQPAVSRQVRQLEAELGLALFEQIGKTLDVTDAGQTLVVQAEELLGHLERVAEAVSAHRAAERGRISVGASSTPGLYLLPQIIGEFCRRFPDVQFHYCVENSLRVEQKILRNELDIGLVGVAPTAKAIRAEPLIEDRVVCFASPDHPLAKRRDIEPRALARETWVIRERGAATRQLVESWMARRGVKPSHAIEMSCPEGIKALVAAGVGFSYMSLHGMAKDVAAGKFAVLDLRGFDLRRSIYLLHHVDKHISPVMEALVHLVRSRLRGAAEGDRRSSRVKMARSKGSSRAR